MTARKLTEMELREIQWDKLVDSICSLQYRRCKACDRLIPSDEDYCERCQGQAENKRTGGGD